MSLTAGLLTGYVLMRTIGKQKKGAEALTFGGALEVSHSIEGRLRVRSERLKSETIGQMVAVQLTKIDGIDKVKPTALTGSLLVEYNHKKIDKNLLIGAIIKLVGLEEQLELMQHSKVYKEIQHINQAVNQAVLDKTAGTVDVKTLIPLSFVGMATYKILTTGQLTTPSSVTMLWWAYNSLNLGGK